MNLTSDVFEQWEDAQGNPHANRAIHPKYKEQHNMMNSLQTHLAEVNRDPLTAPKQDSPTKTGISQDITPRWYSPKLCQTAQRTRGQCTFCKKHHSPAPCNQWLWAAEKMHEKPEAHHSDGLRLDHGLRGDGGEVGHVGQDVDHRHYRHGYDDGQWQVPMMGGYVRGYVFVFMRSVTESG